MEKKCKSRDITGLEIGGWIPHRLLPERTADGEEQWECECRHCGTMKVLRKGNIKKTRSCGCLPSSKDVPDKYVGKQFGMLTGLRRTDRKDPHNGWIWEWACNCGSIVELPVKNVTSGRVKSCGCLAEKDITGKRFGRLVAICPTEKRERRQIVWKFRCDCGQETEKPGYLVASGSIQSCGCLNRELSRERLRRGHVMGTNLYRIRQEGDPAQRNNTSGCPGVWYDENLGRYMVRMQFQGVLYRVYSWDWDEAVWIRQMFVKYRYEFVDWWNSLTREQQVEENVRYIDERSPMGPLYLDWLRKHAKPDGI